MGECGGVRSGGAFLAWESRFQGSGFMVHDDQPSTLHDQRSARGGRLGKHRTSLRAGGSTKPEANIQHRTSNLKAWSKAQRATSDSRELGKRIVISDP